MKVELRHHTPIHILIGAIRTCWDSKDKMDTAGDSLGEKDERLVETILNKGHTSTLEHITYNFHISGISRLCLQELARHRMANFSVKSSRYTLRELRNVEELSEFIVESNNTQINNYNIQQLRKIQALQNQGIDNDTLKYLLPESYKTELYFTINARSLRNLFEIRGRGNAHPEIRKLAFELYEKIPQSHRILFLDIFENMCS